MTKKGVSPVIATILMVMITVGLVAFSYSWFMRMAEETEEDVIIQMDKVKMANQKINIMTVFVNGSGLYFEVKASGLNTIPIDIEGTGFYIEGVPKTAGSWSGFSTTNCTSGSLVMGSSCYGMVAGYDSSNCHIGDVFKVAISWGAESSRKIKGCANP